MYENKSILAIIPARSGSKGLANKNIRLLFGKPLIVWTIEQAFASNHIDKIIISTDDEEIAEVSRKTGADVPFIRPKELATDETSSMDVVLHAIDWIEKFDKAYDLIILLQPTSPNRISEDIDNSIELIFHKNASSIVSVCKVDHHPHWSNTLPPDGCMVNFVRTEIAYQNRQELSNFYRLNGAIYLAYCDYLKTQKSFFGDETYAYIMPGERSIDIDCQIDFEFAEFLLQRG